MASLQVVQFQDLGLRVPVAVTVELWVRGNAGLQVMEDMAEVTADTPGEALARMAEVLMALAVRERATAAGMAVGTVSN